jgi:hypothetical protein
MTGLPIDIVNKKSRYRKETLFGKVLRRLRLWDENQALAGADALDAASDKKSDKKKAKAKKKRKAKEQKKHPK